MAQCLRHKGQIAENRESFKAALHKLHQILGQQQFLQGVGLNISKAVK